MRSCDDFIDRTETPSEAITKSTGTPRRGKRFAAGDVSIDLNEGGSFNIAYVADRDTITLHLGVMTYNVSVGRDRLSEITATIGQLGFGPQGADVRSRRQIVGERFVNIRAPAGLWESLEHDIGRHFEKRELVGAHSAGAHRLATMARDFVQGEFPGGRLAAESLACLALSEVQSLCREAVADPKATTLSQASLRRVLEFIDSNVEADLGLGQIADVACLSPAHFSRVFTATTGMTPSRYVAQRRVAHAQALRATTTLPIAEIAYRAGFSSQSHLTTSFRKSIGVTPAAFRKDLRS